MGRRLLHNTKSYVRLLADIEANDLLAGVTDIWCACFEEVDNDNTYSFTPANMDDLISFLIEMKPSELIFHNGIGYDLPALEKVLQIPYSIGPPDTLLGSEIIHVDTLLLSKLLNPDREGGHSLEAWGKRLGEYKGSYDDWSKYTPEMLSYCMQDVKVLKKIYFALLKEMNS